jgi:hypothetical protein
MTCPRGVDRSRGGTAHYVAAESACASVARPSVPRFATCGSVDAVLIVISTSKGSHEEARWTTTLCWVSRRMLTTKPSGVLSARWRAGTTRMLAPAPRLLNSSALAKHMKRWPILNAVAGTTGNCEALVPDQSSFKR